MMEIECPECLTDFEVEPCFDDGKTEKHIAECPNCEKEVVYDIYFDPMPDNVRMIPKCKFKYDGHDYGEWVDRGHYRVRSCIHCDKDHREWGEFK